MSCSVRKTASPDMSTHGFGRLNLTSSSCCCRRGGYSNVQLSGGWPTAGTQILGFGVGMPRQREAWDGGLIRRSLLGCAKYGPAPQLPATCQCGWGCPKSQSVDRRVGARHLESCRPSRGQAQTSSLSSLFRKRPHSRGSIFTIAVPSLSTSWTLPSLFTCRSLQGFCLGCSRCSVDLFPTLAFSPWTCTHIPIPPA
jgi:hypothetical protein